jgi:hypothetical protein
MEVARTGSLIIEKVISETFLIAGGITALVLLAVLFLKSLPRIGERRHG